MKYALIQTENYYQGIQEILESVFILRGEFDTLEEAKAEQAKIELKSIVIQTH